MDGFKFFLQFVRIVFGFIFALVACGLFLAWGFFQPSHPQSDPVGFAAAVGTGLVTASVLGGVVFVPVAVAILISEVGRFSSLIFHLAAAGLVALLVWTLGGSGDGAAPRPGTTIVLAAGFVAGFVYWLVAGRTAGYWQNRSARNPERVGVDEPL